MKFKLIIFLLFCITHASFSQTIPELPIWKDIKTTSSDWLIDQPKQKADVYITTDKKNIILYNGLVRRSFRIEPNIACTDFQNMSNGQQLLRSIRPEAIVTINGKIINIGGLNGQKEKAYLIESTVDGLTKGDNDFICSSIKVESIKPLINWKKNTWGSVDKSGSGKIISFFYHSPNASLNDVEVVVHYELYDGIC